MARSAVGSALIPTPVLFSTGRLRRVRGQGFDGLPLQGVPVAVSLYSAQIGGRGIDIQMVALAFARPSKFRRKSVTYRCSAVFTLVVAFMAWRAGFFLVAWADHFETFTIAAAPWLTVRT